jgi:hypothetical protein
MLFLSFLKSITKQKKMTTQETYISLDSSIIEYIAELDNYSEAKFGQQPAEGVWSVGQVYEHLFQAARLFFFNIKSCLNKENGASEGGKNENGQKMFALGSFPPIKIKKPKEFGNSEPTAQSLNSYKEIFEGVLSKAESIQSAVAQDDGSYKVAHPILGLLTAQEWYTMMEMHFRHHRRQITELIKN